MAEKIKFKLSIEKFSIEYEGTREAGQVVQAGIARSLAGLVDTQRIVMATAKPIPTLFDAPGNSEALNGEATNGEATKSEAVPLSEKPKRAKRQNGQPTIPERLLQLKQDGFFATPRTASAIQDYLKNEKGHNIKAGSLTGPLQKLTQQGELYRKMISDVLNYQDKPFDESPRSSDVPPESA